MLMEKKLYGNLTLLYVFGKTRSEKNVAVVWDDFFVGEAKQLFIPLLLLEMILLEKPLF